MTEPATLIALAFHATVPGLQDEIHTNPESAFARFGVTKEAHASFGPQLTPHLPSPEAILEVVKVIATKAVDARIQPPGTAAAHEALQNLAAPTKQFFAMVAPWLAAELALGVQQPDQPRFDPGATLLNHIYLLLYSSEYRATKPAAGNFDSAAWHVLSQAADQGSGSFSLLLQSCQILCGQLADECNNGLWMFVW